MNKLKLPSICLEAIDINVRFRETSRVDNYIFARADYQETLIVLTCKRNNGCTDSGLVVFKVDGLENLGFFICWVNDINAGRPSMSASGMAKLFRR